MGSELNEGPSSKRGNTGECQVVTRRYNRNLLLLMWGLWVVSSIALAWGWATQSDDDLSLLGYGWAGLALLGAVALLFSARERFVVDEVGVHRRGAPSKTDPITWAKIDRIRRDSTDQRKSRLRFELSTLIPKASPPRIDIDCTDAQYQQILKWHP